MGKGLRSSFTRVLCTSARAVGQPGTKAWRWRWNSENSLYEIGKVLTNLQSVVFLLVHFNDYEISEKDSFAI